MNHDACDKAYAALRADKIRIQEELEAQVAFLKTDLAMMCGAYELRFAEVKELRFALDCEKAKFEGRTQLAERLGDALASVRVLVAMDTLPENVPNEAQRQAAVETLALIDSLIK